MKYPSRRRVLWDHRSRHRGVKPTFCATKPTDSRMPRGGKHKARIANLWEIGKNFDGLITEWHPVRNIILGTFARDGPELGIKINLAPSHSSDLV